jgi:hypothetical protein
MATKNKVTYILGAGASAKYNALPTVARYSDALNDCADFLRNAKCEDGIKKHVVAISQDMERIAKCGFDENTVDAYANWCFINKKSLELYQLKKTLAFFFTVEQYVRKKFDPRYRQFITTLLSNNPLDKQFIFPDNVKIINWNYDFQVQLACNRNGIHESFSFDSTSTKTPGQHKPGIVHYYPTMATDLRQMQTITWCT